MTRPATSPTRLALAILVLTLLAAVGFQVRGGGADGSIADKHVDAAEAVLTPNGGKIALPGKEAILLYPKGAVDRPVRIRVEKVSPEDLPGPIQEGVVVIGAVHLTHPDLDYSQPYTGVYKHNPLQILFRWENYAEEPSPEGRYYTAVCQWDDYQGRGTFGVVRWGCDFSTYRRVVEYEGGRYFLTSAPVVPPNNGGLGYYVLVQFPKELSRRSCEEMGGVFEEWPGLPFCSDANGQGGLMNDMAGWIVPPGRGADFVPSTRRNTGVA